MLEMSDDDCSSGSSGILWYQVGRSSGYRDGKSFARRLQWDQEAADQRAGLIKVSINYINELAGNRDELLEQGNKLARMVEAQDEYILALQKEITSADAEISRLTLDIASLNFANDNLKRDVKTLERSNADKDKALSDKEARLVRALKYNAAMDRYNLALLKAAEDGKTDRPEYLELKEITQSMRDIWSSKETKPNSPPSARLLELLKALER
jgi:septal ring factor EnvC (AmiA/AmiB activator)